MAGMISSVPEPIIALIVRPGGCGFFKQLATIE
jgi:hypothetical protein